MKARFKVDLQVYVDGDFGENPGPAVVQAVISSFDGKTRATTMDLDFIGEFPEIGIVSVSTHKGSIDVYEEENIPCSTCLERVWERDWIVVHLEEEDAIFCSEECADSIGDIKCTECGMLALKSRSTVYRSEDGTVGWFCKDCTAKLR